MVNLAMNRYYINHDIVFIPPAAALRYGDGQVVIQLFSHLCFSEDSVGVRGWDNFKVRRKIKSSSNNSSGSSRKGVVKKLIVDNSSNSSNSSR